MASMLSGRQHVERQRQRAAAQGLNLGLERRECRRVATGNDEVSARSRQRPAKVLAQPAAGTGDNGHLAG